MLIASLLVCFALSAPWCVKQGAPGGENVLVLIADDLGVDRVAAYGLHPDPGRTPNLDRLAARGVLFWNVWSNPKCSPTRATLLTGRYGFRTGMGDGAKPRIESSGLDSNQETLPRILGANWATAAFGKWHLSSLAQGPAHALECGFDSFAGSRFNLAQGLRAGDYFAWQKLSVERRGETFALEQAFISAYATSDTTDDALAALSRLPEPWLMWVAYNAPHKPDHAPPAALHSYDLESNGRLHVRYQAMTEALDSEIGRLLTRVPANTTVIFLGDNGSASGFTTKPFQKRHAKGSVYEGGIRVPLIVSGPRVRVPGNRCHALVNTTDLLATVAEIAGTRHTSPDSISFLPYLAQPDLASKRHVAYAEIFAPNGFGPFERCERALRDQRFKLIRHGGRGLPGAVVDELYDLEQDPFERNDLLRAKLSTQQDAAYQRLGIRMQALLAD